MINVLDCTLRDGGYYSKWDFDKQLVRKYIDAISNSKVDIIEVGFRYLPQSIFVGANAYTTEDYLSRLNLHKSVKIAVMVDAKQINLFKYGAIAAVNKLFLKSDQSFVDIVRIAVSADDIDSCYDIAKELHSLGYSVFVNLMRIDAITVSNLVKQVGLVENWGVVDVIYIADSFGSLDPLSIKDIVKRISNNCTIPIGVHAHDNKGYALLNSLSAYKEGATYIDSTILGIGRGAGNTRTESLLLELNCTKYCPEALFLLVQNEFSMLMDKYRWGHNIYYQLASIHNIHPSFIQTLLLDKRYGANQIIAAINFFKGVDASNYSLDALASAISGSYINKNGKWSASGFAKNKDVLIIGSGPNTNKYIEELEKYIKTKKPIVLCLNINKNISEDLVTAYVACHEAKIPIEAQEYVKIKKPLVIPISSIPKEMANLLDSVEVLDYGLKVSNNSFEVSEYGCIINSAFVLGYAISVATAGGANNIVLIGIDGYEANDHRQIEVNSIFSKYNELNNKVPIYAITPTTCAVGQRSIFETDFL